MEIEEEIIPLKIFIHIPCHLMMVNYYKGKQQSQTKNAHSLILGAQTYVVLSYKTVFVCDIKYSEVRSLC